MLLALLAGCGKHEEDAASGKTAASATVAGARELARADVEVAQLSSLRDALPFTGTLAALKSSSIAAEVEARVKDVLVREGESVRQGQELARLDSESLDQSVSEQQAQLAGNQSRLKLARIKLDKQHELLQKGFISQLAYDEAESEFTVRQGELQAQISQLARARRLQADSVVRAPIAGVVYERKINPGEIAAKNARLFSIADLSVLELSATVPAQWIGRIQPGQQARFNVEGLPDELSGAVVRVNPVAQSGTRSFLIYIRVDNRDGRLKAGQFAKGGVVLRQLEGQVVLPQTAVQDLQGKPWVMLVEQGRLQRRPVQVLLWSQTERKVALQGVKPGQLVLSAALLGVAAGDAVSLPTGLK